MGSELNTHTLRVTPNSGVGGQKNWGQKHSRLNLSVVNLSVLLPLMSDGLPVTISPAECPKKANSSTGNYYPDYGSGLGLAARSRCSHCQPRRFRMSSNTAPRMTRPSTTFWV